MRFLCIILYFVSVCCAFVECRRQQHKAQKNVETILKWIWRGCLIMSHSHSRTRTRHATPLENNSVLVSELSFRLHSLFKTEPSRICPSWRMYTAAKSWQKANRGCWRETKTSKSQYIYIKNRRSLSLDPLRWNSILKWQNNQRFNWNIVQFELPPAVAAERMKLDISCALTEMRCRCTV